MNYLHDNAKFETPDEGIEQLTKAVAIRDQMGGSMFFNMLNDDCCEIASKAARLGADRNKLKDILGKANFILI